MRKEKGITLVSLVVTIIILIILAGVSINLVLGENGIITKAKEAKTKTEQATLNEEIALNELYYQISEIGNSSISYDNIEELLEFKRKIASAITDMGIETEPTDTIDTMANNIKNIKSEVEPLIKSYTITITGATHASSDYSYKTYYTSTLESIEGYTPYTAYIYSTRSYNGGVELGSEVLDIIVTTAKLTSDKTKAYVQTQVRGTVSSSTKTTIVLHVLYLPE